MRTSKRFYVDHPLFFASSVLEDCVRTTTATPAFGVDSGDTWELSWFTSDIVEDFSDPRTWILTVLGRVTDVSGPDEGQLAGAPSIYVLGIEANAVNNERTKVDVDLREDDLREYLNRLLAEIERYWPYVRRLGTARPPLPGGRPGLTREQVVYRVAKAQEGEEIKQADPAMTWKEIAREISWASGSHENGLALLRDARYRLRRLESDDPELVLDEVAQLRASSKAENTQKT